MIFNSSSMELNIKNAVPFLTFKELSRFPFVTHAFSTRMGGVSGGEFTSMNMSFGRGDPYENVIENYRRLCSAVGVSFLSLTASAQDHHTFVRRVTRENCGVGITRPKDIQSVDALITNDPYSRRRSPRGLAGDCRKNRNDDSRKNGAGVFHGSS